MDAGDEKFMSFQRQNIEKYAIVTMWILTMLVSVKSIFTDFGIDNAYQVAMSYRHLNGDRMLSQMWEPHQFSIWFNDILMALYRLAVPSLAGVAIFLQICGTALFYGLSILLYRTLRGVVDFLTANLACMFLVLFRAKQTPFPEFSNLEIACSVLIFCSVMAFLKKEEEGKKSVLLILAALFVFLQTLSYPTCLFSAVVVVVVLLLKSKDKLRNCLVFGCALAMMGCSAVAYFVISMGLDQVFYCLKNIYSSDTHSVTRAFGAYWPGFLFALAGLVSSILIGFLLKVCLGRYLGILKKFSCYVICAAVALLIEIIMLVFQRRTGIDWNCCFFIIPSVMILLGMLAYSKMDANEKTMWLVGLSLSMVSFLATSLLTDLGLITILAYFVLGGIVSMIPIRHLCSDYRWFLTLILLIVISHRALVVWGYGNTGNQVFLTYEVQSIIHHGPAMGIVCDRDTANQSRLDQEAVGQFVREKEKLFVVGPDYFDSIFFLYEDIQVCNYSTIDTPYYNECLEAYLDMNPQKVPTVVAVARWYQGEPRVAKDSWIMQWVERHYTVSGESDYWFFYR